MSKETVVTNLTEALANGSTLKEYRATRKTQAEALPGFRRFRLNPFTDTSIAIVKSADAGYAEAGSKSYSTVCLDHGVHAEWESWSEATPQAGEPWAWCANCEASVEYL